MRLLCYLLGDGGTTHTSILFSNIDAEILDDLRTCLPSPCQLVHRDRCTWRIKGYGSGSSSTNPVQKWCVEWGIKGTLSKHKRIPAFVFGLQRQFIAPLLNALFACDGWVDKKGFGFASASKGLVEDVRHLLLRFGIRGRVRYKPVALSGKIFDSWLTVTSIEPMGDSEVWDITVQEGHNFIADDVFAHNTSWGPWWLWREIQRCGSGDYLAVTATFDLFKLKMLPEIRSVFEHTLKVGRYWAGAGVIEIRDPATGEFWAQRVDDPMYGRIILRSAAAGGGLESATAKAAWLDECGQDSFTVDTWDAVQRRLSLAQGRVFGGTTPYNLGWLKREIFDQAKTDPNIEVIQFASIENPMFPKAEFEARRAKMPTWKFNMFYRGLFERPAGLIYSDFIDEFKDNGGHKVKPFEPPIEWPRYVGVDPGAVNTAMVWLAHQAGVRNVREPSIHDVEGVLIG